MHNLSRWTTDYSDAVAFKSLLSYSSVSSNLQLERAQENRSMKARDRLQVKNARELKKWTTWQGMRKPAELLSQVICLHGLAVPETQLRHHRLKHTPLDGLNEKELSTHSSVCAQQEEIGSRQNKRKNLSALTFRRGERSPQRFIARYAVGDGNRCNVAKMNRTNTAGTVVRRVATHSTQIGPRAWAYMFHAADVIWSPNSSWNIMNARRLHVISVTKVWHLEKP